MSDEKKRPPSPDRRTGKDRRRSDRRKVSIPVPVEHRKGPDRRSDPNRRSP